MYFAFRMKGATKPARMITMNVRATVKDGKIRERVVVMMVTSAATVTPGASASAS